MLRKAGLRVTDYRLQILGVLADAQEVLDAAEIFARLREHGVDRVTVYRTLAALVASGLAHKVDPGDRRFRYGITDHSMCTHDHHLHEHPHLVCERCARVECLHGAEVIIRQRATEGGRAAGANDGVERGRAPLIREQQVTLHGLCSKCNNSPS